MSRMSRIAVVFAATVFVQPALAQAINEDGAKALSAALSGYIGKAAIDQKIVTITPQSDAYRLTFDAGKLAALYGVPAERFQMGPLSLLTAPKSDGTWTVKGDTFPAIAFTMAGPDGDHHQEMRFSGYKLDGVYDPKLAYFTSMTNSVDFAESKAKSGKADIAAQINGLAVDLKGAPAQGGVDAKVKETIKSVTETITTQVPGVNGAPPTAMTINVDLGAIDADVSADALRSREVLDLWAFFVAHASKDQIVVSQDELKTKLKAALPLWNLMAGGVTAQNVAFRVPQGTFGFKSFTESLRFSGATKDGSAAVGFKFDGFTMPAALLPAWAGPLIPTTLDLNLAFSGADFDQMARAIIDQADFKAPEPWPPTLKGQLTGMMLAGKPKVTLAKSRLTAADYDLSFEGEMQIALPAPTGRLTILARDFEKTVAALQQVASQEPQVQQMLPVVIFAKGLAKPGPDGQSVWVVEYGADGVPVVNGQKLGGPKK